MQRSSCCAAAFLLPTEPQRGMQAATALGRVVVVLSLDTILSSLSFHARTWSPDLIRTQARDLLRFLTIRLYSEGKGNLQAASLTISQSALADKLGITREWCNQLLAQLKVEGWITYSSGRREGGLRTTCTYGIGNMLRRLIIMLSKSHAKKAKQKHVVKSSPQVFPPKVVKRPFSILERGHEPPNPAILSKIPLLSQWWNRGGDALTATK